MTITEIIEELEILETLMEKDATKSAQLTRECINHIKNSFKNFYFTFGTWPGFPYQDGYLIIKANSGMEAIEKFSNRFRSTNFCACYSEEEWNHNVSTEYYHEQEPIVIIY